MQRAVICVSIADQEIANLTRLMNDVFGEETFLSIVVVQSNKRGQTYKEISKAHEYIVIFSRTDDVDLLELEKASDALPYEDALGRYDLWELRNRNPKFGRFNRAELFFAIYVAPEFKDESGYHRISLTRTKDFTIPVYPRNSEGEDGCWRWGKGPGEKLALVDLDVPLPQIVAKQRQDGGWNIYEKSRKATTKVKSLWTDTAVISEQGTLELDELGLAAVFDHPKPIELVKRCISIACENGDTVLDFFGGSGTTAQAVMDLNAADGCKRQFILVQLPEFTKEDSAAYKAGYKKISDITIERNKRVIERYRNQGDGLLPTDPKRQYAESLGFKVYTLEKSNFPRVDFAPDPDKTGAENVQLLKAYIREKEDTFARTWDRDRILDEVLLKNGFMLDYTLTAAPEFTKNKVETVRDAHRSALICLDEHIAPETVDAFRGDAERTFICLEAALDSTKKWNLKHHLGERLRAI